MTPLERLAVELRRRGHGAEDVANSPAPMLNVWRNDEGRTPDATLSHVEGTIAWGHNWEHEVIDSLPVVKIADQIEETWA